MVSGVHICIFGIACYVSVCSSRRYFPDDGKEDCRWSDKLTPQQYESFL